MKAGSVQLGRTGSEHQYAWTKVKHALIRICLWLVSFLLADVCFSLFFGFFYIEVVWAYFFITLLIAWPAWCLFLPVVIAFKDAEKWRLWAILTTGILVGPLSLVLWDEVARLHRDLNAPVLGLRDPLNALGEIGLVFAFVVGSLATCAYVYGLKILYDRMHRAKYD